MAGCGYVCPLCEGKGFIDIDKECDYCNASKKEQPEIEEDSNKREVTGDDNSTKV